MVDIIEGYETEEQQVDAIKGYWKKYGNILIISAVIILAALWGWRFYHTSSAQSQEEVSQEYTDMMIKFEAQGKDKDFTAIKEFISAHNDNNYASLARLSLTKEAIVQKDFKLAKKQLQQLRPSFFNERSYRAKRF
ncbi:YfgM family protein [Psychromonas sp. CD1]|uniref:YfgM family protein n=1 Tax=Psychromonas sp. CD1 TaxID=1979839 RepID=UPI0021513C50|nr:tetratricopeptide repeat protein [Psychromonas sp. CD1]